MNLVLSREASNPFEQMSTNDAEIKAVNKNKVASKNNAVSKNKKVTGFGVLASFSLPSGSYKGSSIVVHQSKHTDYSTKILKYPTAGSEDERCFVKGYN